MSGITQWLRLALDRASAAKAQQELQDALRKGTDPKHAKQNLSQLERSLESVTGFAKKAGAALAGFFAVRKVADFAVEMFKVGTAAEETGSKFQTTFGAASKQVQQFIDDFGTLAGLTRTQAQEMTATAGAIVQGMGASKDASAEFSERMIRLAADITSFSNVPIDQTFTAIKSGLVGSWEPLDRFGIVLRQADVDARALTETGKTNAAALTQQEKALAALNLMYERAGPALGDLERTQDSTANKARKLVAEFGKLKEEVALSLMPAFERLVNELSNNQQGIADLGRAAVGFVTAAGPHVVRFFRDLAFEIERTTREIRFLISLWEKWQNVTRRFYGNERILDERERRGLMRPTGRNEDTRSDNERQREIESGVRPGRADPTTPPPVPAPGGTSAGASAVVAQIRAETSLNTLLDRQRELRRAINTEADKTQKQAMQLELKEIGLRVGELRETSRNARTALKDAEDAIKKRDRALSEEISLLAEAAELRVLSFPGIQRAIELEDQIRDQIAKGNVPLKERVDLERKLKQLKGVGLDTARTMLPAGLGKLPEMRVQYTVMPGAFEKQADEVTRAGEALWARMEDRAKQAADTTVDVWTSVFAQLGDEITTVGGLFEGLWHGVLAGAGMAVAAEAKSRAGKAAMEALEQGAKAISALATGNFAQAGVHATAVAKWTAVTAGWSALAGGGAHVAGGGWSPGRGGAASRDPNPGRGAQQGNERRTYVYVSVDPFDPKKAVHAHAVGSAVEHHVELAGRPSWARASNNDVATAMRSLGYR